MAKGEHPSRLYDRFRRRRDAAINDVRGWGIGDVEGVGDRLGEDFVYRNRDLHYSRQRVATLQPGEPVVWEVTDARLCFVKRQEGWIGTRIMFDIATHGDGALLRFAHVGLTPDCERYGACSGGSFRLAFVAAIQDLPPRQRATLLLCDVLGWSALEASATPESSPAALNSALQRARETLGRRHGPRGDERPSAPARVQTALLDRYLRAWEGHDLDGLVATLRADAVCTMPQWRLWLPGRPAIAEFFATAWKSCPSLHPLPLRANADPAFAVYQRRPDGRFAANALHVSGLEANAVASITPSPRSRGAAVRSVRPARRHRRPLGSCACAKAAEPANLRPC